MLTTKGQKEKRKSIWRKKFYYFQRKKFKIDSFHLNKNERSQKNDRMISLKYGKEINSNLEFFTQQMYPPKVNKKLKHFQTIKWRELLYIHIALKSWYTFIYYWRENKFLNTAEWKNTQIISFIWNCAYKSIHIEYSEKILSQTISSDFLF